MVRRLELAGALLAGCLSTPAAPAGFLLGDMTMYDQTDLHPAGQPEAASFQAVATTTVDELGIFYEDNGGAATIEVALYSNTFILQSGHGDADQLLAAGTIATPHQGWNAVTLDTHVVVTAGEYYWIAGMAPVAPGNQGMGFRYHYTGDASTTTDGMCDVHKGPCTEHGPSMLSAFPVQWDETERFAPSLNSFYASHQ